MPKDPSALSAHYPEILRLCQRMLGNPEDAADAAQETFRRALQQPEGVIADPRRWLAAVARNLCIDEMRRRREGRSLLERSAEQAAATQATGGEPEHTVLGRMFVGELLDQLTHAERRVVAARLVDDRSTRELAATLGVAPVTTRVLLARGLGRLRRYLTESPARMGGAGVAQLPGIRTMRAHIATLLSRLREAAGSAGSRTLGEGLAVAAAALTLVAPPSPTLGSGAAAGLRPSAVVLPTIPRGRAEPPFLAARSVARSVQARLAAVAHGALPPDLPPAASPMHIVKGRPGVPVGTPGGPSPVLPVTVTQPPVGSTVHAIIDCHQLSC